MDQSFSWEHAPSLQNEIACVEYRLLDAGR